ncbi:DUF3592 domain-containing protein [Corallococcus aberystwythensis]|uniref:DUF3592 domain-containing protein n=1 Tax=Corallococcus aberystwythensis TaxID=2316722 RepID=A0A3A8PPP5_9BACT|nr:DUF3592 domain-containing protein [Corallococcus aberystwythensis]RKH55635.1 hypothetical protein D7W81_35865 [Corallococcus aberystwythensis]
MSFEDLLGLLAGFVGLPAIILSLLARSRRVTVRLEQQGLRIQGQVTFVKRRSGTENWIYYAFQPAEGPERQGVFTEPASTAMERRPGSSVEVLYLADAPQHYMTLGGGLSHQRFLLVAALLVGFSLLGVLVALHSYSASQGPVM